MQQWIKLGEAIIFWCVRACVSVVGWVRLRGFCSFLGDLFCSHYFQLHVGEVGSRLLAQPCTLQMTYLSAHYFQLRIIRLRVVGATGFVVEPPCNGEDGCVCHVA